MKKNVNGLEQLAFEKLFLGVDLSSLNPFVLNAPFLYSLKT